MMALRILVFERWIFVRNYLRIWSKIRAILGWLKFVSAYVERDKKNLKLAVFGIQVAAFLIDFFTASTAYDSLPCGHRANSNSQLKIPLLLQILNNIIDVGVFYD